MRKLWEAAALAKTANKYALLLNFGNNKKANAKS